jgi:hypothetical protein
MDKPIEIDRVSALVTVADLEEGEPPVITTVHPGADGRGTHRHFVQQVPILDRSLFDRLSHEVNKGDQITVTVVNEWYATSHVTYLADFKGANDLSPESAVKNGTAPAVRDDITEIFTTPDKTTKTEVR